MSRIKKIALVLGAISAALYAFFQLRPPTGIQQASRFIMGTVCTIQVPGPPAGRAAIAKALDRLEECDRKFSVFIPSSPVARFNQAGTPIDDPEVVALIAQAVEVSRLSAGAFDITVFPLVELWGFYGAASRQPAPGEIAAALRKIGWQNIVIANGRVTKKNAELKIDLGAIAKGYAVGAAAEALRANNIHDALIDAGGDIYALGKLNNKPWQVGIRHPRARGILGRLDLSDLSVATSGDYAQFFIKGRARYHHIFDPRTGYPATNLASVSVIGRDAALADAWSTALFVMGPEKGMRLVAASTNLAAIMITAAGQVLLSPGLKGLAPKGGWNRKPLNAPAW